MRIKKKSVRIAWKDLAFTLLWRAISFEGPEYILPILLRTYTRKQLESLDVFTKYDFKLAYEKIAQRKEAAKNEKL